MNKRTVSLILLGLLLLLQYPLWFGKGGFLRVWEMEKNVAQQKAANEDMRARNQQLEGEVNSLRSGLDAIEERARFELGMTRSDEVYVQIVKPGEQNGPANSVTVPMAPPRKAAP